MQINRHFSNKAVFSQVNYHHRHRHRLTRKSHLNRKNPSCQKSSQNRRNLNYPKIRLILTNRWSLNCPTIHLILMNRWNLNCRWSLKIQSYRKNHWIQMCCLAVQNCLHCQRLQPFHEFSHFELSRWCHLEPLPESKRTHHWW